MNCATCHDGTMANPINFPAGLDGTTMPPIGSDRSQGMFHSSIVDGRMPQGSTPMPPDMREPLVKCVRDQYYAGYGSIPGGPGILMRSVQPDACGQLARVRTDGSGAFCLDASGAGTPTVNPPSGTTAPPLCAAASVSTGSNPPPPPPIAQPSGGPRAGVPLPH